MEMMDYYQLAATSSYQDSLKVIEADIQHANMLWVYISQLISSFELFFGHGIHGI